MLITNPRQDLFAFNFPSTFFDTEILAKYDKLVQYYNIPYRNMKDVINASIMNISTPAFEYTPIEQIQNAGSTAYNQYKRSNENIQNLIQKTFTVSIKHVSGYLTYYCMLEHYFKFYSRQSDKRNLGTFPMQTLDELGNTICTIKHNRVLFTGITGLDLAYSNSDRSFISFDCSFYYSDFDTSITIPEPKLTPIT